jgi:MYXO-CTERM domain-containing protein
VAYNSCINCSNYAEWTGGSCDGGATEVTVAGGGAELTGVKIHHNYSYNSCGFFEISSGFSSDNVRGKFTDSEFYNNVTIDSGWLHLLQVANTDMHNIRWENNTLVQHKGSLNQGILMVVYTAVASGMSGGQLYEDSIYWTNNLFVADGVNFQTPDSRVNQTTNLIIKNASTQDPGFKNLKGMNAEDYDLVEGSPAINEGTVLPNLTLDFLNRTIPDPSGKADIGAFEFGGAVVTPRPVPPSDGGGGTTVVPPNTGGSTTIPAGTGGATIPKGTAGTTTMPKGSGGSTAVPKGTGGSTTAGSTPPGSGGQAGSGGQSSKMPAGTGSGGGEAGGSSGGGEAGGSSGGNGTAVEKAGDSGCSCRLGRLPNAPATWAGLLGFALLALRRRRRR